MITIRESAIEAVLALPAMRAGDTERDSAALCVDTVLKCLTDAGYRNGFKPTHMVAAGADGAQNVYIRNDDGSWPTTPTYIVPRSPGAGAAASRMTTQTPDAVRELPQTAPGHWDTEAGRDMAIQALADPHMEISRKRISDFALANEVFLSAGIVNLTYAKERIRWLSASLAVALAALDSRAGDAGEDGGKALFEHEMRQRGVQGLWADLDEDEREGWRESARVVLSATPAPAVDAQEGGCTCQRYPTHQANDCPLHGLEDDEPASAVNAVPAGEVLKQQAHEWRRRELQAIGAAISTRSWHAVEQAYNSLRDKMDAAGCWHAPAALSHGEGRKNG